MLTHEENELVCRVTGDAPAGRMIARYWLPACWSDEVAERDGAPVRVRMLGHDYVAFRDSAGELALVDAACPHRLASLGLARNEEGGLRCIYHGWKFDVRGRCIEMPTEPAGFGYADRVKIRTYPVRDAGGLLWTYLGPPEHEPPFPAYDWTSLPRDQIAHMKFVEHTSYLQAAEGTIDSAHSWFLHRGIVQDWKARSELSMDLSPRLETEDTTYGFRYGAIRSVNGDPNSMYVKVTLYMFPTTAFIARPMTDDLPTLVQIFVPIDDEHTMHYSLFHSLNGKPVDEAAMREKAHLRPGIDLDANFRHVNSAANGWNQDRAAMKDGSWCGIDGFQNQDVACQESMGAIVDRSQEHLGTSDVAIIRMRRRMLESIRRFQAGEAPIGLDVPIDYPNLRSEQRVIGIDEPWQQIGAGAGEYVPGARAT
jgi:phthalate 4,5-dioxygenase